MSDQVNKKSPPSKQKPPPVAVRAQAKVEWPWNKMDQEEKFHLFLKEIASQIDARWIGALFLFEAQWNWFSRRE